MEPHSFGPGHYGILPSRITPLKRRTRIRIFVDRRPLAVLAALEDFEEVSEGHPGLRGYERELALLLAGSLVACGGSALLREQVIPHLQQARDGAAQLEVPRVLIALRLAPPRPQRAQVVDNPIESLNVGVRLLHSTIIAQRRWLTPPGHGPLADPAGPATPPRSAPLSRR